MLLVGDDELAGDLVEQALVGTAEVVRARRRGGLAASLPATGASSFWTTTRRAKPVDGPLLEASVQALPARRAAAGSP